MAAAPLTAYPNPCTTELLVPADPRPRTAEVLDLTGRRVLRQELTGGAERIGTAALPSGMYVLRVLAGGEKVGRQVRFSKQ